MTEMQDLSARLKKAVTSEPIPPYLQSRVRAELRSAGQPRRWLFRLAPVALGAMICLTAGIAYQLGHLRMTVGSQESYIRSVTTQVATLIRVGLGDHLHCAVFRKFPAKAPSTQEFVEKLGPKYAGLLPIVQQNVPAQFQLRLAHQCRYHDRTFVHLSLMSGSHLMSLVLTVKEPGESFEVEGIVPALVESGIPMYQAGVQRFQISAFESSRHLAYVISDLPKQQNTDMMLALAPPLKDFLQKQEL